MGKNSSGKSQFLKQIFESASKKTSILKIKSSFDSSEDDFKVVYWPSETVIEESFSKKTSLASVKSIKMIEMAVNSVEDSYHSMLNSELEKFSEKVNKFLFSKKEINIAQTGIDVGLFVSPKKLEETLEFNWEFVLGGIKYDLKNASTGVKTIVTFFLNEITDFKSAKKKLFLLDEPEAFLHPEWIDLLCVLMSSLLENNNFKMILVTHSPQVISKMAKKYLYMISTIDYSLFDANRTFRTLDWNEIITKTTEELQIRTKSYSNNYANFVFEKEKEYVENYVSAFLTTNASRVFFDNNIVFVEGMVEEIYFGVLYPQLNVIQTGGFYQFVLLFEISKQMDANSKSFSRFIMDCDFENDGSIKKYNQHVFEKISFSHSSNIFRFTKTFEVFLTEKKFKKPYEKIDNVLNFVSSRDQVPVDPHGEIDNLGVFLSRKM